MKFKNRAKRVRRGRGADGAPNTGSSDHVGIVADVSGNAIVVIEGNYSDQVKQRTLERDGRYIRGYGIPDYD